MTLDPLPAGLRLNQIQFIATHNSSHQLMAPDERFGWLMGSNLDSYRYEHLSLDQQLNDQNVRGIELDVYPDPEGGRYARPLARPGPTSRTSVAATRFQGDACSGR